MEEILNEIAIELKVLNGAIIDIRTDLFEIKKYLENSAIDLVGINTNTKQINEDMTEIRVDVGSINRKMNTE